MNIQVKSSQPKVSPSKSGQASWRMPAQQPMGNGDTPVVTGERLERYRTAGKFVFEYAQTNNVSKAKMSNMIGINNSRFNQWLDGTYNGDFHAVTEDVEAWIKSNAAMTSVENMVQEAPSYVLTKTSQQITQALTYAHSVKGMVVVTAASGCGKTITCEQYAQGNPHVHHIELHEGINKPNQLLSEIAHVLKIQRGHSNDLVRAIGERLMGTGQNQLLILDEAQNLNPAAVNQARHFKDRYNCGIAFVGNDQLYTRLAQKEGQFAQAQIHRRIGLRVKIMMPYQEDIDALVNAWKLTDPDVIEIASAIGQQDGALGHMTETLQLATMLANGDGQKLSAQHIQQAWSNRSGGA